MPTAAPLRVFRGVRLHVLYLLQPPYPPPRLVSMVDYIIDAGRTRAPCPAAAYGQSRGPAARLPGWGWRVDESDRIVTDTGRTVFAAGFVTAIGKALESLRLDH